MTHYIALIHKDSDSCYGVSFPDIPGVVTAGDTIDNAIAQAGEALEFAAGCARRHRRGHSFSLQSKGRRITGKQRRRIIYRAGVAQRLDFEAFAESPLKAEKRRKFCADKSKISLDRCADLGI